ncbi:zinc carboxypeptidase-like [Periplaneta americana]|uniref:zinc carboxypeptidase-like n=1 Tax=Periplaneta americana TaxID=6978 RepID=UPI0037E9AD39
MSRTLLAAFVSLLLCSGHLEAEQMRFDRFQVFRLLPDNDTQVAMLQVLEESPTALDFWSSASSAHAQVDVMVPPDMVQRFRALTDAFGVRSELRIQDVQKLIDSERPEVESSSFGWDDYHNITMLHSWLDELVEKHPGVLETQLAGLSYEGRQIKGVKLSYQEENPGVFIEAGIHAREWIAPATATWILNQLLSSQDENVRFVAENFDWYIFPSVNPDGYQYSHTTNRRWRKTRSRTWHRRCVGVDPNRNWDFHWVDGGASRHPCSETYAGSKAFSEAETQSLARYIGGVAPRLQLYLALHSYGQKFLIPYGHTRKHIADHDKLATIAKKAAKSLSKRYGTIYKVGNIVETYGLASGGSVDWVRGTIGTPLVYAVELRDTGHHGFILPATEIVPTAQETLDAITAMLRDSRDMLLQAYNSSREQGQ